jgi:hypothetical protein
MFGKVGKKRSMFGKAWQKEEHIWEKVRIGAGRSVIKIQIVSNILYF